MITAERGPPERARDGQGAGTTAELPSVPWLLGQILHDSDVTLKAFLWRRQVEAFQSEHKNAG